jgi:uncharacterized membrane protein YfcA
VFEYIVAFIVALGSGIVSAVVGLGGGFLFVPTLTLLFNLNVKTAMGTSLAVIIFTSFSASFWYHRQGKILYKVALVIIPPSVLFSVIGSMMTRYIDTRILAGIFSAVLILISLEMLIPAFRFFPEIRFGPSFLLSTTVPSQQTQPVTRIPYSHLIIWGAVGGFLGGITGTSGGTIFVPALATIGVPMHYAVATSMFSVIALAIAGAITYAALGQISLPFMIVYGIGAALGSGLGTVVATRTNELHIRRIFGFLLIFMALLMVFSQVL